MTDATLRIKNLSIALEAISRVGGSWSQVELYDGITKLLKTEIKAEKEANERPIEQPPTNLSTTSDDDIPF